MKTNTFTKLFAGFLIGIIAIFTMAARTTFWYGNQAQIPIFACESLTVDEAATIATVTATDLTVATSSTNNGIEIMPSTAISVTSPTVTITAAGARLISITTDETQTGLIINGGTVGQVLSVRGTNDSSTMRVDDGTSYTINSNAVLGLGDWITLRCVEVGDVTSRWEEISRSLN